MKKLAWLLLSVVLLGTLTACGSKTETTQTTQTKTEEKAAVDQWKNLKEKGIITVGLDDEFVPMGFRNENNEIVGFDVDMAKEAIKKMGLEVKFQPIDWAMKENELSAGNIDLIWNGYTITDARKQLVTFSDPYMSNTQAIVTLTGSDIKTKADLKGKVVATQDASSGLDAINASGMASDFDGGKPILFANYNEAFIDLEAGRVDALVADLILARYYIQTKGPENYAILEENFGEEEYAVGMRKGDLGLIEALNLALKEMKTDGTAKAISEKWFGENLVK